MVAIIDYDAGNVRSLQFALERLGAESTLTDNAFEIENADKIIFPGQGAAGKAMEKLKNKGLDKLIPKLTQPVLGICLGMQLLCESTEEDQSQGLGIVKGKVTRFSDRVKVPQMGWNTIHHLKSDLFKGLTKESYAYFVHGYYASIGAHTIAQTNYILDYSSALQKDNFYGVQFHPEKSAAVGERIIQNFLNIK